MKSYVTNNDIICFSETFLNCTYDDARFNIPGYRFVRNNRMNRMNKDIANKPNDHFGTIAKKVLSDLPQNIIYEPSLEFSNFVSACVPESNFGIPYMSVEEVEKALSNLNTKKATGMDDIPASFLKTPSSVLAGPLCKIINHSFSEGKFPTE